MSQQDSEGTETVSIHHWYDPDSKPLSITDGDDATVWDEDGNEYLDFCSQLYCTNLGHSNEAVITAMEEQAGKIPYVSSAKRSPTRDRLAEKLARVTPESLSHTFFSVSGSEANETAVQIAREYQDAPTVLTRWRSYHGGTYGAGALTGDPETRATIERHAATSGAAKFLPPIPKAFDTSDPEELARRAGEHLEFVIRNEGPDSVAAILTEPIAGTSGAFPAPPGYFDRVRDLCDEYDILLVADEVITGFGRCGDWFGVQTEDIQPDMLTFAKGVTSAYAPLAGVSVTPEIASFVQTNGFDIGQTFGGHPMACAAGCAAVDEYANGVIDGVTDLEEGLASRIQQVASKHDVVHDVRGRGGLWAVEFADPETETSFHDPRVDDGENPVAAVLHECRDQGVLLGSGRPGFQIIISPPLIATQPEIDRAMDVLDDSITAIFG
ncbi:aspartate aminotransferase family protein [Haladaptatus pallidirubidus]|uniref:Aspartate aminotransferase family protein n=1 Tax=Haladaptatus pallidirubidus TaxID=1008152 RepID=A0AAV3URC7_9EURY|nr:aminotransferase class III-fold pyridoxal phosphate-dependent enzyme [Haladaptatus pallidirubidus]